MYRVRLTSGEETAFRSVEELALGIQSGVITGEAQIYHATTQQWLPISVHPEYVAAADQASAKIALSAPEAGPAIPDADVEVLLHAKVPIYKMVSVSARELEAKRRPRWVVPATTGGAFLIFLGAVALASAIGGSGTGDVGWARPNVALGSARVPTTDSRLPERTFGALRSGNPDPAVLARNAAAARAEAASQLGKTASQLGMQGLVNHQRLATPDSLRAVRQAVAAFRPAITQWRNAEADVVSAYRDTASALAHSGRWDPAEFTEWRVRAPGNEALATIRSTDSLMVTLDRAYALLQESGRLDSAGNPSFTLARSAAEYDQLRATVIRLIGVPAAFGEHVPPPLVILRSALGGKTFPARASR